MARILLIDDHTILREGLRSLIEKDPLAVVVGEAGDGAEAVRLTGELRPDLVIMDLTMPIMNGIDATRMIRTLPGGHAVPIVAMTANAFSEDRQRCVDAGMDDFISKPVMPETLYAHLLKWLEQRPPN